MFSKKSHFLKSVFRKTISFSYVCHLIAKVYILKNIIRLIIHNNNSLLPFHWKKKKNSLVPKFIASVQYTRFSKKQRKMSVSQLHPILKKQRKKRRVSPHICAQYKISGPQPNPNLGLSKMYQVPLALSPSVNYFWTASEGKQNEIALFMIQINVFYLLQY